MAKKWGRVTDQERASIRKRKQQEREAGSRWIADDGTATIRADSFDTLHACPMDSKSMFPVPCECVEIINPTPRPWYLKSLLHPTRNKLTRIDYEIMAPNSSHAVAYLAGDDGRTHADAEGIVRAVNSHDALVSAVSEALSIMDEMGWDVDRPGLFRRLSLALSAAKED